MAGDMVARSFSFFITFGVGGQIRWIYPPLNKPKTLCVTLTKDTQSKNRQTMSDHSISIVPRQSSFPDNKSKAKEILDWLVSKDIVNSSISDCVLGSDNGYSISEGAKKITDYIDQLPFDLITNGLNITTNRQIFHTGQNGMDECICPNCNENIVADVWDFLDEWFEQKSDNLTCTQCGQENEINRYSFEPQWGFSNLGFTFWNWSELKEDFIQEFQKRLGTDVCIVYTHI